MIFYFSATGNSFYIAKKIKESQNERILDIAKELKKKELNYEIKENEKIGFIFPVYFYGVPNIVIDFVNRLSINASEKTYIYSIITCGGSTEGANKMFKNVLNMKGLELKGNFSILMPDNYIILSEAADKEKQELIIKNADESIIIINDLVNKEEEGENVEKGFIPNLITNMAYPFYRKGRKTKKFKADESCIGCSLCEKICPVDAIKVVEGKPEWIKKDCVHCLGCINRCPVKAIQYGRFTKNRRRYVNPILKVKSS